MAKLMIDIDGATGGLSLVQNDRRHVLHPLWVRERVTGEGVFDPATHQRLYEHADISTDIRITRIVNDNAPEVQLDFSDGEHR
jgi:hypothetical protein